MLLVEEKRRRRRRERKKKGSLNIIHEEGIFARSEKGGEERLVSFQRGERFGSLDRPQK